MIAARVVPPNVAKQNSARRPRLGFLALMLALVAIGCWAYFFSDSALFVLLIPAMFLTFTDRPWYFDIPVSALGTTFGTAIYIIITVPMLVAWAILDGRKGCILYLRRFRRSDSANVITRLAKRGFGHRYRVVTLDDQTFIPVGVPTMEKALLRSLVPAIFSVFLAIFAVIVSVGLMLWIGNAISVTGLGVVGLLLIMGTIMFAGPLVLPLFSVLIALFVTVICHHRRIRQRSRIRVFDKKTLSDCAAYVQTLTTWARAPAFMAPQATVVTTTQDLWQSTIIMLAERCSAVIVDVSEPTINLLWEIRHLRQQGKPMIFIAEDYALRAWTSDDGRRGEQDQSVHELTALLEAEFVLTYSRASRRDIRCFRRQLLNLLLHVAPEAEFWPTTSSLKPDRPVLLQFRTSISSYAAIWFAVGIMYWAAGTFLWPFVVSKL